VPVREVGRRTRGSGALVADARLAAEVLGWRPRYPELDAIVQTPGVGIRARVVTNRPWRFRLNARPITNRTPADRQSSRLSTLTAATTRWVAPTRFVVVAECRQTGWMATLSSSGDGPSRRAPAADTPRISTSRALTPRDAPSRARRPWRGAIADRANRSPPQPRTTRHAGLSLLRSAVAGLVKGGWRVSGPAFVFGPVPNPSHPVRRNNGTADRVRE
jgi:hypothetical protein